MTKGLAIIAFLAVLQTVSAQQPTKASIEGTVLRVSTDEPLASVHVTLTFTSNGLVKQEYGQKVFPGEGAVWVVSGFYAQNNFSN